MSTRENIRLIARSSLIGLYSVPHAKMVAVLCLLFELSPMNKFVLVISLYCSSITLGQGFAISSYGYFFNSLPWEK